MKYDVIVTASGKGERAALGYNKILFKMKNGKMVIEEAIHLFLEDKDCNKIIIVSDDEIKINNSKILYTNGGITRKDSVYNGLKLVTSPYVLVHDGARPFLNINDLNNLKNNLSIEDAAILVKRCIDTVKYSKDGYIEKTIDRNNIYLALTPQGCKSDLLRKAYTYNIEATDEASLLENIGIKVKLVIGSSSNIKLTNKEDFINI